MKEKVLFICNHNAARSQMAEGYLRSRYGDRYEACSAGIMKSHVSRNAVAVMREIGIDISGQRSKTLDVFLGIELDYVVTLSDETREACPLFQNAKTVMHEGFLNPAGLAGSDDEVLAGFRRVRDALIVFIDREFGVRKKGIPGMEGPDS